MAAPTNTSSGAAEVITTLPFSAVYETTGQTSALELWWKYTAMDNDRVVGVTPFATITGNYDPRLRVLTSDAVTVYKGISAATQRSVAVPVTAGQTLYYRVLQGGAGTPLNVDLTFEMVRAPQTEAPAGSIISTDQGAGAGRRKPPIISALATQVYQYIDNFAFMVAAIGTQLDNGTMCGDDEGATLQIWSPALVQVYDGLPSYFAYTPSTISSNGTDLFYLKYEQSAGNPDILRTLTPTGSTTADAWTLPANSENSRGGTPNRAETIYYYGQAATGGSAVHRYDLVAPGALSDLAATLGAGWFVHPEIVLFTDGTILVGYTHPGAVINYKALHYSAAGAVLQTYDFGANPIHHLSAGLSDVSFYVWLHDAATTNKRSIYRIYDTATAAILSSGTYDHFDSGIDQISYDPTYPSNDGPRFGVASTCTFFIVQVPIVENPNVILPEFATITDPIRRQRTAPHLMDGTNLNRLFYPGARLDFEAGGPRDVDQPLFFDLTWSDDGGHTWSNIHRIEAGNIGNYGWRAIWRRLGMGRYRTFRVTESNPAKIVWLNFYLDPDPEQGEN